MLYDPASNAIVYYEKLGDGYVRIDDWDEVDADAMLKSISDNTEADNVKRRSAGISPLHVIGWMERPRLDRTTKTVRWAIEAMDEREGATLNSVALILGRDGFEKLTWIGPKSAMNSDLLRTAQVSFSFPTGGRYSDHQPGDKLAEYGIAGLVAAVLGAKVATKLGLLAVLTVFAKKIGVLIVVPFALFFGWIKRRFSRKPPSPPPLPPEAL